MDYILKNKYITLSVNSYGASMQSLEYLGEERLWQGGEAWGSRDVVIFPVVGHAGAYTAAGGEYTPKSHGVARYSEFALVENSLTKLVLELASNAVTKRTYPYDFVLRVEYELKKNTVSVTYNVRSKGGSIPFYVGGHPGMKAPGGEALIEFENEEDPIHYYAGVKEAVCLKGIKKFVANKELFKKFKTLQFGNLSGGKIYAHTADGYVYTYKSDCPIVALWSNEDAGDYICVEPWWGIGDCPDFPAELEKKPFINFADENGKSFTYKLTVDKE